MILDSLANAERYFAMHPLFEQAFGYLRRLAADPSAIADGRHEVVGSDLYAAVQTNVLKLPADGLLETHRKYIDIQFLLTGTELIGHAPFEGQAEAVPFSVEKDIAFHFGAYTPIPLLRGYFMILHANDAHAPGLYLPGGEAQTVRKVILKVAAVPA